MGAVRVSGSGVRSEPFLLSEVDQHHYLALGEGDDQVRLDDDADLLGVNLALVAVEPEVVSTFSGWWTPLTVIQKVRPPASAGTFRKSDISSSLKSSSEKRARDAHRFSKVLSPV